MIAQHYIDLIAGEIKVKSEMVEAAVTLFDKGATIPFVARYRKDLTGGLSESKLERIEKKNNYFIALTSRKNAVLENIEKQGRLTEELRTVFDECHDHIMLEDLSLPFKKQRNNRAAIAANKGLLPLADYIWAQSPTTPPPAVYAESFVGAEKQVLSVEEALEGARHILAECIAMNLDIRKEVRQCLVNEGILTVHPTRVDADKASKFSDFKDYQQPLKAVPNDVFLVLLRGEQKNVLRVELEVDDETLLQKLASRFIQDSESAYAVEIQAAVTDAYKRLLRPVIEEEVFTKTRRGAEDVIIAACRDQLRNLLLTAPAGPVPTIGLCCWSPQERTLAAVNEQGDLVSSDTIKADATETLDAETEARLAAMLETCPAKGIAISSGPGGREALRLVQAFLRNKDIRTFATLVQDAGLAVYAHSSLAESELTDLDAMTRAAVSIARRFQDPLRELVKVEPHNLIPMRLTTGISRRRLQAGAVRTVESVVNRIGVDANKDSAAMIRYVSGLQLGVAQAVVEKRKELGGFKSRVNLLDVSGIGEKTYQQCVGFMRISGAENPLDESAIHPEFYPAVDKLTSALNCPLEEVMEKPEKLRDLELSTLTDETVGPLILEDICYELRRIGRDPRRRFRPPQCFVPLNTVEDLKPNMVLEGTVTNITDFGIFVSFGLDQEGLVHRSEVGRNILNDPKRALQVGDIVKVLVLNVDMDAKRIALSIRGAVKLPLTKSSRQFRRADGQFNLEDRDREPHRRRPEEGRREYGRNRDTEDNRPQRRQKKGALPIQKIGHVDSRKGKGAQEKLLNTTLADQLAALRDKIISKNK